MFECELIIVFNAILFPYVQNHGLSAISMFLYYSWIILFMHKIKNLNNHLIEKKFLI